jgi:serine/threonine protein kinase/formylglycine-generating enzyme required for sulfatase activity
MIAKDAYPSHVGRYRVDALIGEGSSGMVFRGEDEELGRLVAIKVIQPQLLNAPRDLQNFLAEARTLARLDHPSIVSVYDAGRLPDGTGFIIGKLINGRDLQSRMKEARLSRADAVEIVARVAEALDYAHQNRLIHRDIKPANILLDETGRPVLVDFGLALDVHDVGKGPTFVGTVPYMSPEQARREGHRVDSRTDIYSLGVVLYELLLGRRPFLTDSKKQMLEMIRTQEVPPLRDIDASLPPELEWICLKALANRVSERYATAADFAGDLRAWQRDEPTEYSDTPSTSRSPTASATGVSWSASRVSRMAVVPRGLRSFGTDDAGFFLKLLPGPRDREGLPDSIAFWKTRIEAKDAGPAFRVGLLYGPSGCGKSSFVKAGLLPRLDSSVVPIYLEAAPEGTEETLLQALRRRLPALPPEANLVDAMHALRLGRGLAAGQKILIVLDQFEQWLHAPRPAADRVLIQALRQCDGARVQTLLLVRDDFWLPVSQFLHELDERLAEGENAAAVDLFALSHARSVMTEFGRAYLQLPAAPNEPSREECEFIDNAVAELGEQGKVVPVRLALFVEMVKHRPWTPATLRAVGGAQGIGVVFLEETFHAATAPPAYRQHATAARAVLGALLPEAGGVLKGRFRSRAELLQASGYAGNPAAFEDLLKILDAQMRLVSPASGESDCGTSSDGVYQLTHDYLVPAVQEWVTRGQRETLHGRARLRLAERSASWNTYPENRLLPSWVEWATIGLLTRPRTWTDPERRMMRAATRYYGIGSLIWLTVFTLISGVAGYVSRAVKDRRDSDRADIILAALRHHPHGPNVPDQVRELDQYQEWVVPKLHHLLAQPDVAPGDRLHARLLLARFETPQFDELRQDLLTAHPPDVIYIRKVLGGERERMVPDLWRALEDPATTIDQRLRLAGALAGLDPDSPRWKKVADPVDDALVHSDPLHLIDWLIVFKPVHEELLQALRRFCVEGDRRDLAVDVLTYYAPDEVEFLARSTAQLHAPQSLRVWPTFSAHGERAIEECEKELARPLPDVPPAMVARRHARLYVALLRLGRESRARDALRHRPDPLMRSYFIHDCAALKVDPRVLFRLYEAETEPSIRRGLILALGEYPSDQFSAKRRQAMLDRLRLDRGKEPDPGTHSAIGWLLRRWHADDTVHVQGELWPRGPRCWYTNSVGNTLVVLPGGVRFHMGTPGVKTGEPWHERSVPRAFAIASREVTVDQFLKLMPDVEYKKGVCPTPDVPIIGISWYQAVRYCRLLSEAENIPEDEMCYPPVNQIKPGMKLPANYLVRTGYRLPTEVEWEYACRAGTSTVRFYGDTDDLLVHYAWFALNSGGVAHPRGSLKPNDFGLFDTLGNTMEWCDDWYTPQPDQEPTPEILKRYRDQYQAKVLRGGELSGDASELRAAARTWEPADQENHHYTSLRLVRTHR